METMTLLRKLEILTWLNDNDIDIMRLSEMSDDELVDMLKAM